MILLDTNHLSVLAFAHPRSTRKLLERLEQHEGEAIGTTIVTAEESLKGWLAAIHQAGKPRAQIQPYLQLLSMLDFLAEWDVMPLNAAAVDHFESLRSRRIRIGSQDLKIASIALAHDALLLSANLKDFELVPELRVENWLDG